MVSRNSVFLIAALLCWQTNSWGLDSLRAQPGFEGTSQFSNWTKQGGGTFSRTTGTARSGAAKGQWVANWGANAIIFNQYFNATVPSVGEYSVTISVWARRNGTPQPTISLGAASSIENIPETGSINPTNLGTGYVRYTYVFDGINGDTYFPVIYLNATNVSSNNTAFIDDVWITVTPKVGADITVPTNAFGFKIDVDEPNDSIHFTFSQGTDLETGIKSNIIIRFDNVVNQNNNTPPLLLNDVLYSTNPEEGVNRAGTGGLIVYAGPAISSYSEKVLANKMTYVLYSIDSANNISNPRTGQTIARLLILKNQEVGVSITNNHTMAAMWVGPGSTYTISGAATMNMADNGVPGGSTIYGTMWQNTGNINQRANPPATLVYKSGSRHINNRPTVTNPDGNYLPTATWEEGSLAEVVGLKPTGLGGTGQIFYNLTWNTTSLGVDMQMQRGFGVMGDFIIRNTEDTANKVVRTLYMPDTAMVLGGNFIIEDPSKVKIIFPGPTGDLIPGGTGNIVRMIGTGDQYFTNNDVIYDLFSLDVSKPSGSFVMQQDLQLRGNLNHDAGGFVNNDFKLIMQGKKADAAYPQVISGEVPITFKEVIINNTNNAIELEVPDSNYVANKNNFTVTDKLTMQSGKLIADSKTLTIFNPIEYTSTPKLLSEGGTNNFFGGRTTGNMLLTGNIGHQLYWGDADNELDTLRFSYSNAQTSLMDGLSSIYTSKLLVENNTSLINHMDVEEAFIWALDSLYVKEGSNLNNEVLSLFTIDPEDEFGNGFGFGIGGNARIDGNWTLTPPQKSNGRVLFKGSKTHNLWGSQKADFYNMELDNPAGINILNAADVRSNLYFTNGIIHTVAGHPFSLYPTAVPHNPSNTRFINGPMHRMLAPAAHHQVLLNPVGKVAAPVPYRPVWLYPTQVDEGQDMYIEYFSGIPANEVPFLASAYLTGISKHEYWEINKETSGNVNTRIKLNYLRPGDEKWSPSIPSDISKVAIMHGTGYEIENASWSIAGEELPAFTIEESGDFPMVSKWDSTQADLWTVPVSNFSPFGFGKFGGKSILPIKLLSFQIAALQQANLLTWQIENEQDLQHFWIEYSKNGQVFNELAKQPNTGNKYEFKHYNAGNGNHYYRLKWLEKDGKVYYSQVQTIASASEAFNIGFPSPMPFSNQIQFSYLGSGNPLLNYVLHDAIGRIVYNGKGYARNNSGKIIINGLQHLPAGNYTLTVGNQEGARKVFNVLKNR